MIDIYAAQFYSHREQNWFVGQYMGPDEETAKAECRDYWRRGADGVRVLVYRTEVIHQRIRDEDERLRIRTDKVP